MIRISRPNSPSHTKTGDTAHQYRIAGQTLCFQAQVASLSHYESGPASATVRESFDVAEAPIKLDAGNANLRYRGEAQFDRADRLVEYWRKDHAAQVDIDGEAVCNIDLATQQIHLCNSASFDNRLNLEAITGPALVTLLALKNIYCMHAGAVSTPAANIMFVGESGAGKSTLSAHVDGAWSQLADDILPLELWHNDEVAVQRVRLGSDFPQLKLDGARVVQPVDAQSFVDLVIRINPIESKAIEFTRLSRTAGLLQIVRHTVAARLFDKTVMREHAKFAKTMSGLVPVVELSYPRDLAGLDELRSAIVDYAGELKSRN